MDQGTGVFRIRVDVAAQQCAPQDARAAEAASVLDCDAMLLRGEPGREVLSEFKRMNATGEAIPFLDASPRMLLPRVSRRDRRHGPAWRTGEGGGSTARLSPGAKDRGIAVWRRCPLTRRRAKKLAHGNGTKPNVS